MSYPNDYLVPIVGGVRCQMLQDHMQGTMEQENKLSQMKREKRNHVLTMPRMFTYARL